MVADKKLTDERIKLASIMNILNKQNDILNEMEFKLITLSKECEQISNEQFNPIIVSNYYSYSNKLSQDIKMQKEIIKRTEIDLSKQQEGVKKAYIKVKSLESLKEKQKEKYNQEFLKEEFKEIDDIVPQNKNTKMGKN